MDTDESKTSSAAGKAASQFWPALRLKGTEGLSIAAILYVAGYLVWSLHAWMNDFGPLPALEAQYMLAGVIPVLLAYAVFLTLKGARWWFKQTWLGDEAEGIGLAIRRVLGVLFALSLLSFVVATATDSSDLIAMVASGVMIVVVVVVPDAHKILEFKALTSQKSFAAYFGFWRKVLVYYVICAATLLAYLFNVSEVHAFLPQELGGMRPVRVQVDIETKTLSAETLETLTGESYLSSEKTPQVLRSKVVELLFVSDEITVIRVCADGNSTAERPVFRLKRDAIHSILWNRYPTRRNANRRAATPFEAPEEETDK